jgi:hypothetical protein
MHFILIFITGVIPFLACDIINRFVKNKKTKILLYLILMILYFGSYVPFSLRGEYMKVRFVAHVTHEEKGRGEVFYPMGFFAGNQVSSGEQTVDISPLGGFYFLPFMADRLLFHPNKGQVER